MKRFRFDVIVIGCGPAGATAAVSLARAGLSVLILEAGVYAGAENWSGCIYFTENLAQPDAFGEEAVEAAPYERRLVRRGIFLHNGLDLIGLSYQHQDIFRYCYSVLRPIYDPYWAELAKVQGAMFLPQTTVTSLIRRGGRVIGVDTEHGPVYAEVVFLAEGDASHLIRREKLERVAAPHFMQGVKAVLGLPPAVIEERFGLSPKEGCAYEYLIRNGQVGGQTTRLNMGAFLYTNRDSLSFGYVVSLENLKKSYRGDHSRLLEWLRGLPHFRSLLEGTTLSAYGAKLIRGGGLKEQPILVEDGLAVGGAATGLGVDLPYPNFTGPASASGLFFARAIRRLLTDGQSVTGDRLRQHYLEPLKDSVYGANAAFLSDWPDYLENSRIFLGRSVDLACGTAHFLTQPKAPLWQTARFLRGYLRLKTLREFFKDGIRMLHASGWQSSFSSAIDVSMLGQWVANLFRQDFGCDPGFAITILTADRGTIEAHQFPWLIRNLLKRLSPGLAEGMRIVYANNDRPLSEKFREAFRAVLGRIRVTDLVTLPCFVIALLTLALSSAVLDLIRYYLLRRPVEEVIGGPVAEYLQRQQNARDLDQTKTVDSFEAKLATNSYRIGRHSHIRVLWPSDLARHGDLIQSSLWSVCPARVYQYEPPLVGRGMITVNYENCIKCETCWHAADDEVRWGRHTNQRLIYRPESEASQILLRQSPSLTAPHPPREITRRISNDGRPQLSNTVDQATVGELFGVVESVRRAVRAFETSIGHLPASADATRRAWPHKVGRMALDRVQGLRLRLASEKAQELLSALGVSTEAQTEWRLVLDEDHRDFEKQLSVGQEFRALSSARRIRQEVLNDIDDLLTLLTHDRTLADVPKTGFTAPGDRYQTPFHERIAALFPDRVVKEWEVSPIPEDLRDRLLSLFLEEATSSDRLIRALSFVNPALGLLAAHHVAAVRIFEKNGQPLRADLCAVNGNGLAASPTADGLKIQGALDLIPLALSRMLLLIRENQAWILSLNQAGVRVIPTPGIGFRAAHLHRLEFNNVTVLGPALEVSGDSTATQAPVIIDGAAYTAIALGAGDYLSCRAKEHAEGRVQFSQQMRDTQGRDGIAKLGAVKAMIARIEAWHLLLSALSVIGSNAGWKTPLRVWPDLCAAVSAMAFGPEVGQMGYDAGQVFGGMAYSEDDLISRVYRDSALFRYLPPGFGAAGRLMAGLDGKIFSNETPDDPLRTIFEEVRLGPMAETAARWDENVKRWEGLHSRSDPAKAGEAAALLLGTRWALCIVQEMLREGRPVEGEAAACAVLIEMTGQAIDALEVWRSDSPILPVPAFPERPEGERVHLPLTYETLCMGTPTSRPRPYHSGQYLLEAFDPAPRFVPEIGLHDETLRNRWKDCTDWFIQNFWSKSFEGLQIERYMEKIHGIPKGALDGFKEQGYFSTIVPSELDGGGWWKAEYYILTTAAGRFGDAGLLLVIMASTSIGTTPMLLSLEKELPLAVQELEPLARDPHQLGQIGDRLDRLIVSLKRPDPGRLKKGFSELMDLVDSRIRHTRVVKYLSANFLKAFYAAGVAGQRQDLEGFTKGLKEAKTLFDHLSPTIQEAMAELPCRERAHRFFIKKLGHGGVSAFALTEPTAGSDTGGVKTTARPKSRALTPLEDGRHRFYLTDGEASDEPSTRYLIDADQVQFDKRPASSGMGYRIPSGEIVPIQHDEYNYDTDEGLRYYMAHGQKRYFHDIAQIRHRNGRAVYDYYELNGAKMWITNGHVATQFCLYAQSPEGVTGFMVDRHSEGLKVGADERKMGQRGSPTNEIAIDQVRVPKECVIGYEGHGQVNALETLNVGRCGLAVASITLMRKLLMEAKEQLPATPERDRLLGEAAAILFASDSVTFHLIGLFDRDTTGSVRMESAIAKYLCSEDLHELITLIEQAYGPAGVTEQYRVEKIRRDSRILTIYEGTNEVQRFLILKDLIAAAQDSKPVTESEAAGIVTRLAFWKETLRTHLATVSERFGDTVWMDAVLQPTYFPLSDMAGEIFRLDCLAYRLQWLRENRGCLGPDYTDPLLVLGERAVWRCEHRLSLLNRQYLRNADQAAKGLYAPEAVAADAALERMGRKRPVDPLPKTGVARPLRILCLLRLIADVSPIPHLKEGQPSEIVWRFNPSDEAAVGLAVRLRENSRAPVTVHLIMPGRQDMEHYLRWALGSGADAAYQINAPVTADGPIVVEAITQLEKNGRYDVILTGAVSEDGAEPLGPFVAGATSRLLVKASSLEVINNGQEFSLLNPAGQEQTVPLLEGDGKGLILVWDQTEPLLPVEISRLIEGCLAKISHLTVQEKNVAGRFVLTQPVVTQTEKIRELSGVAHYLKTYAVDAQAMQAKPFEFSIAEIKFPADPGIWTILESEQPRTIPVLLGAARVLGQSLAKNSYALVVGPEKSWPNLIGIVQARGLTGAICLKAPAGPLTESGRIEWLKKFIAMTDPDQILCGPDWTDPMAYIAGRGNGKAPLLFTGLTEMDLREGLFLLKPAYGGKLRRSIQMAQNPLAKAFITVSTAADFHPSGPSQQFFAGRISEQVIEVRPDWFDLTARPPREDLSLARLIIDVGYGIRNQEGFNLAVKLKEALEQLGLTVHLGATRKVTQDLKLLSLEHQIGQTGIRINPKLILALGVSGAPQHMDYIGDRAVIFAFNKDPEAPLMKFNETRPAPVVHPIVGNLFETVPKLIEMLSE